MKNNTLAYCIGLTLICVAAVTCIWSGDSNKVLAQQPDSMAVTFPDRGLEDIIRGSIKKPSGPIYVSDLEGLHHISSITGGIYDLTGLEYCVNLQQLVLHRSGSISDISPLVGLHNLTVLYLGGHNISDISPLAGLSKLEKLDLSHNQIIDISPLAGLASLKEVNLMSNRVIDITPLGVLTDLEELNLWGNDIIDISPLLSPAWLSRKYPINLFDNPLSITSRRFGIPLLQKTGISFTVDTSHEFPDWSYIPGSLIAWAGLGLTGICYFTAINRRKWLRVAAMVLGVTGTVLLVIWLLPAFTSYFSFEILPVSWGIATLLGIIICLFILIATFIAWRYELIGGILLIAGGLIAGIVYPLWIFHTSSILTGFPLVSGILFLLSWREGRKHRVIEPMEKEPGQTHTKKRLPDVLLTSGIWVTGPVGLIAILFYGFSVAFMQSPSTLEQYLFWLFVEVWSFNLICSILARREYRQVYNRIDEYDIE